MQQFGPGGGTAMYEEASSFARVAEPGPFSVDDNASASCAAFLGLDDGLDRNLKSSGLPPLHELHPSSDALNGRAATDPPLPHHLDFELEDNGQLLHDMLQQQQEVAQQHHTYPQHAQQQTNMAATSPSQQQSAAAASWEESVHVLQEMLLLQQHQALQCPPIIHDHPSPSFPASSLVFTNNSLPSIACNGSAKFPGESELLSLLQLPRCASSSMPSSIDPRKLSMTFNPPHITTDPSSLYHNASIDYDSQLFLHQQGPPSSLPSYQVSLKHLFHNAPQSSSHQVAAMNAATTPSSANLVHHLNSAGAEEKEPTTCTTTFSIDHHHHHGRQFANPIFDFKRVEHAKGEPRGINHFATERQRREYLNEKYQTLRSLVPNPTKADRASIVQDAIEYVKELKRTVQELQMMVQERNRAAHLHPAGHHKRRKTALHSSEESCCLQGGTGSCTNLAVDVETTSAQGRAGEGSCVGVIRSSLLQRTSPFGTHVDVRIVEEEVNIKLSGKRRGSNAIGDASLQTAAPPRGNPLLLDLVIALHDLHLDLLSASGATIGDHQIFMLNTKIMEGSSTFATQVATKIIEVIDRQLCNSFAPSY